MLIKNKKTKYNFYIIIIAALTIGLIAFITPFIRNYLNTEKEPLGPVLSSNYELLTSAQDDFMIFKSKDLKFSLLIPKDTEITKGGYFEESKPEKQFQSFSYNFPTDSDNLVLKINIGKRIAQNLIENSTIGVVEDDDITKVNIADNEGIKFYSDNPSSWKGDIYLVASEKYFYQIMIMNYGDELNDSDQKMINEVISSFEILE